jgi:hypothetical protein
MRGIWILQAQVHLEHHFHRVELHRDQAAARLEDRRYSLRPGRESESQMIAPYEQKAMSHVCPAFDASCNQS